jgi:hypothetical protein
MDMIAEESIAGGWSSVDNQLSGVLVQDLDGFIKVSTAATKGKASANCWYN